MNYLRHFGLREPPFGITPDTELLLSLPQPRRRRSTRCSSRCPTARASSRSPARSAPARRCCAASSSARWTRAGSRPTCPTRASSRARCMLALAEELGIGVERAARPAPAAKGDHARAARPRAAAQARRAVHGREPGHAARNAGGAAPAHQSGDGEAKAPAGGAVRPARARPQACLATSIRQLRQRITFQHHLKGLDENEVGAYVAHRLAVAGYTGARAACRRQRCVRCTAPAAAFRAW